MQHKTTRGVYGGIIRLVSRENNRFQSPFRVFNLCPYPHPFELPSLLLRFDEVRASRCCHILQTPDSIPKKPLNNLKSTQED